VRDSRGVSSLSTSEIASPPKKWQGPDGQQKQRRLVVRKLLHKNDYTTNLNKGKSSNTEDRNVAKAIRYMNTLEGRPCNNQLHHNRNGFMINLYNNQQWRVMTMMVGW
jgi:hypothetical protein